MDLYDIVQIIVISLVSYIVLFLLTKLVGNKQISQMTMFDYISGISIGSIAAEMATELEGPGRPLIGMLVYGLATYLIAIWTNKSLTARKVFTGKPLLIFDKGTIYRENLKRAKLDLNEFLTLCRIGGYFDLTQLETVIFEHNGNLSFLPKEAYRVAQPNDFSQTPEQSNLKIPVILDGRVLEKNLQSVGKNQIWLERQIQDNGFHGAEEVLLALCDCSGAKADIYPINTKREAKNPE